LLISGKGLLFCVHCTVWTRTEQFVVCFGAMAFFVDSKSFQIYLSSDGCLDMYPDNLPSDFRIVLKNPKELNNKNKSWKVALARLGYDSAALYNLGKNTGTSFSVYVKNKYVSIEMKNAFVSDVEAATNIINQAISDAGNENEINNLLDYVKFSVSKDTQTSVVNLTNVDDFGMSPMLRKLLGFHQNKKLYLEHFEFRKICREFLFELAEIEDVPGLLDNVEVVKLFGRTEFKQGKEVNGIKR